MRALGPPQYTSEMGSDAFWPTSTLIDSNSNIFPKRERARVRFCGIEESGVKAYEADGHLITSQKAREGLWSSQGTNK